MRRTIKKKSRGGSRTSRGNRTSRGSESRLTTRSRSRDREEIDYATQRAENLAIKARESGWIDHQAQPAKKLEKKPGEPGWIDACINHINTEESFLDERDDYRVIIRDKLWLNKLDPEEEAFARKYLTAVYEENKKNEGLNKEHKEEVAGMTFFTVLSPKNLVRRFTPHKRKYIYPTNIGHIRTLMTFLTASKRAGEISNETYGHYYVYPQLYWSEMKGLYNHEFTLIDFPDSVINIPCNKETVKIRRESFLMKLDI